MRNSSLKSVLALMSGAALQIAANAGAALLATKMLPVNERGLMVLCLTVAALVSVLCAGGTGNVLRSTWSQMGRSERKRMALVYGGVSLWTAVGAGLVSLLACVSFSVYTGVGLASPDLLAATAAAAMSQVLLLQVTEAYFAAGQFRAGSVWAALSAVAGLLGVVVMGLMMPTAGSMIAVQAFGTLVVTAIASVGLRKVGFFALRTRVPMREGLQLLGRGFRSMGLPIGYALMTRIDRLILGCFVPPSLIAVYALAVTLAEGIRLAPTAISQLATHRAAEGDGWSSSKRLQLLSVAASAAVAVVVVAGVWLLAVPVFGEEFELAPTFVVVVAVSELGYAMLVVSTRGMIGAGWLDDASRIAGATGIIAAIAYAVGSFLFGAVGCCVARVVVMVGGGVWASLVLKARYDARDDPLADRRPPVRGKTPTIK